jgi:hypothetical protein
LHIVSVGEGNYRTGNEIHGGRVQVTVDRPGKRVTLYLATSQPVTWRIETAPATAIDRVILGGNKQQVVEGISAEIPVVEAFRKSEDRPPLAYVRDSSGMSFRRLVRQLYSLTGMAPSSFIGIDRAGAEPLAVDAVQNDPRLSLDYPKATPLADLPNLSFVAVHTAGPNDLIRGTSLGPFTLGGPDLASLKPLPGRVTRVAVDPLSGKLYGIAGNDVVEIDLLNQKTTPLEMGIDVPPLSWPCGIAFDSERKRLLVASLGGEGFLYALDLASQKWAALASMNNIDLVALAYHEGRDALYGLVGSRGQGRSATLLEFNQGGALIGDRDLGEPLLPGVIGSEPIRGVPQLVAVGDYLVLIAGSIEEPREGNRFYLIEPASGKVALAAKK